MWHSVAVLTDTYTDTGFGCLKFPGDGNTVISHLSFQIVHRTLAAMLGSLAALAVLAVTGEVSSGQNVRSKSVQEQILKIVYICF